MSHRLAAIRRRLAAHGQEHLLAFHDALQAPDRDRLLEQVEDLDFDALDGLIRRNLGASGEEAVPAGLEPAPYYAHDPAGARTTARYRREGSDLVRAGRVAAFCVAGGQATRLGWSGPKGTFPATVVTGKPLMRVLAEQVLASQNRHGAVIPLYVMTSPLNDAVTREFFRDNNFFGLNRRNVFMFPQGMLPSFDARTGRVLLAGPAEVAMNPDGHGGAIKALAASGALDDMLARGIEHISYFQVDNPLVKVIDPIFIGLHATAPDSSAEISSKMVEKTLPEEKVGVFCRLDGKTTVIEYTLLPRELAEERDRDGKLRFHAGSIAVHVIGVKFVQRLTAGEAFALPLHAARKVVPYVDPATGTQVTPAEPNAIKLESFVFDALPEAKSSIIYETSRQEEFAPIKNAQGADSPKTSHQLQSDRAGAWLEAHGVTVPRGPDGHVSARIEISPLTALEREDLARLKLPRAIAPGESIVL
jgi:UDP-N-acetylglucosamine/UDP-N-acetylgalactosamine diphosphorylase